MKEFKVWIEKLDAIKVVVFGGYSTKPEMEANQLAMETQLAYLELDQIFKTTAGGILVIDSEFKVLRYNEELSKITHF